MKLNQRIFQSGCTVIFIMTEAMEGDCSSSLYLYRKECSQDTSFLNWKSLGGKKDCNPNTLLGGKEDCKIPTKLWGLENLSKENNSGVRKEKKRQQTRTFSFFSPHQRASKLHDKGSSSREILY